MLAHSLQDNLHIPLPHQPRKFLSPLDQQNAVLRAQVIQAERLQFSLRVDAIKIDVIEIGARSAIFMHQREGGTGDVFLRGGFEAAAIPLTNVVLPAPRSPRSRTSLAA